MTPEQVYQMASHWVVKENYFKLKPKKNFRELYLEFYTEGSDPKEYFGSDPDGWDYINDFISRIESQHEVEVFIFPLSEGNEQMDARDPDLFERYTDDFVLKEWMFEDYDGISM